MLGVAINQAAQLLSVSERSQRTVNQTNDLAEVNVGWSAP